MRDFWQEKWAKHSTGWDLGRAHHQCEAVVQYLHHHFIHHKNPTLMVPGCGRAHDANYFAVHGYKTAAADYVEQAIAEAKALYASQPDLSFHCVDLFAEDSFARDSFDVIFDRAMLCAISPSQRATYIENCARWLKIGGFFTGVLFTSRAVDPEKGPPFAVNISTFTDLVAPWFVLEDVFEYDSKDMEIVPTEARVICRRIR